MSNMNLSVRPAASNSAWSPFRPTARYVYFDKGQIWLRNPLNRSQLNRIKRHCKEWHDDDERCWWDWRYRQKIQFGRPDSTALRLLAELEDTAVFNYIEITVDLVFRDQYEVQHCFEAFNAGFLHRWHRGWMQVETYPGGCSTRKAPEPDESRRGRWFNFYIDKPCRITGEVDCFHFEGKYCGVQFLRRIGLRHPRDLADFDFDSYFSKTMMLHDLDIERLGRQHNNRLSGEKRKTSRVIQRGGRVVYNQDHRLGGTLYRVFGLHPNQHDNPEQPRSLQRFVDQYGGEFGSECRRFLTPTHIYDHVHKCPIHQSRP